MDSTAKTATLITFDSQTDNYTIPGGVTVALNDLFDVDVSDDNAKLELAYYNDAATGSKNLATGYIDAGRNFVSLGVNGSGVANLVDANHNSLWRVVTITIKVKDTLPSTITSTDATSTVVNTSDALKSLRNAPAKIDVSIQAAESSRGRAFKTNASADDTGPVNLTIDSANGDSLASLITADGEQAKVNSDPVTLEYTAYVYIEGGARTAGSAQKDDGGAVASGAFTVTVAKHA